MGLLKQLLFFSAFILIVSTTVFASHIVGSEIRVSHVQNWDYKVELILYRDMSGISLPPNPTVEIYERKTAQLKASLNVTLDSSFVLQPNIIGCGSQMINIEKGAFSNIITLDSSIYNELEGYYFVWNSCCRNAGVVNVQNSSSHGASAVTLFPPIANSLGQPIINNSPVLNTPASDFALTGVPYFNDFGGFDPDGDSLVFELFTPFDDDNPISGNYNGSFFNGKDPFSQFTPITWASCYNNSNQINGFSDPTCNSLNEPDRLSVDPISGELSVVPSLGPAYFVFGVWCQEYRNGVLIGSVFRDFQLIVKQNNLNPNSAPTVHLPQLQALASWDADTIIFTGSPVCVQLGVSDPDPIADIEIEAVYTDYDSGDIAFVQDYAVINHPDTFQTALCFQPDSFLPYTTRGDVVALNPGCYDLRGDTLPFFFKFVGYSNAGTGGNWTIQESSLPSNNQIDLFSLLMGNPNSGGYWVDFENSGRLLIGDKFYTVGLSYPDTFNFYYIDQQPNYPPDTSILTLKFVQPNSLEPEGKNIIQIYPNPASEALNIILSTLVPKTQFQIFDIRGNMLQQIEINDLNPQIELEAIPDGLYFYKIENQKGKFLIQR